MLESATLMKVRPKSTLDSNHIGSNVKIPTIFASTAIDIISTSSIHQSTKHIDFSLKVDPSSKETPASTV